jgi:hypothetical protein
LEWTVQRLEQFARGGRKTYIFVWNLRDLDVDGRIILKRVLRKSVVRM